MGNNKIAKFIDGSGGKKKIDKTRADWIKEWFSSLNILRSLFLTIVLMVSGSFVFSIFFNVPFLDRLYIPVGVQKSIGYLSFPILFVALNIFIVRTIGLVSSFVFPEIKIINLDVSENTIKIIDEKINIINYNLDNIKSIMIVYNWRGFNINSVNSRKSYSIISEPKEIEAKFDYLNGCKKEVSFLQSNEGDVRVVSYENPKLK